MPGLHFTIFTTGIAVGCSSGFYLPIKQFHVPSDGVLHSPRVQIIIKYLNEVAQSYEKILINHKQQHEQQHK